MVPALRKMARALKSPARAPVGCPSQSTAIATEQPAASSRSLAASAWSTELAGLKARTKSTGRPADGRGEGGGAAALWPAMAHRLERSAARSAPRPKGSAFTALLGGEGGY